MRDGNLENSLDCNYQEDNCVAEYKHFPPQIIKCSLCDNYKVRLLPRGRQDMMGHMEEVHELTPIRAMQETARIPTMAVLDTNSL